MVVSSIMGSNKELNQNFNLVASQTIYILIVNIYFLIVQVSGYMSLSWF